MRNLRKDIVSRSSVGSIQIHGAKTHNLRDVTVCIPKHALVGVAGVSGSGKTSLSIYSGSRGTTSRVLAFSGFCAS